MMMEMRMMTLRHPSTQYTRWGLCTILEEKNLDFAEEKLSDHSKIATYGALAAAVRLISVLVQTMAARVVVSVEVVLVVLRSVVAKRMVRGLDWVVMVVLLLVAVVIVARSGSSEESEPSVKTDLID
nr:hypothetical protein BaRGS_019165 [Batillaria attramentaria]